MATKIQIIINPKSGETEFEIQGLIGSKCTDLTAVLAKGHEVKEEKLTEDYYEAQVRPAFVEDM